LLKFISFAVASAASTWRHSTKHDNQIPSSVSSQDMDEDDDNNDDDDDDDDNDDDDDVAMPQNVSCVSPDMPSCASGMSGKNICILMLPNQLNFINGSLYSS
jgi:hypothetical protein